MPEFTLKFSVPCSQSPTTAIFLCSSFIRFLSSVNFRFASPNGHSTHIIPPVSPLLHCLLDKDRGYIQIRRLENYRYESEQYKLTLC